MGVNENDPVIQVRGLRNSFGDQVVHENLDLDVRRGEILGVVGGSGTGKSVLMRSIIGLQTPDAGEVSVFGQETIGRDEDEAKDIRRRWGILFQGGALFSTLTVAENVQVPIREYFPRLDPQLMDEIASYKIVMCGLPGEAGPKFPNELSGGMKKRVGLARALALNPEVMLYDEPTTGLDPIMTDVINELILQTRQRHPVTSIVVTHDMKSAVHIGDHIAYLHEGRMYFYGTPEELQASPDPLIQDFLLGRSARGVIS